MEISRCVGLEILSCISLFFSDFVYIVFVKKKRESGLEAEAPCHELAEVE